MGEFFKAIAGTLGGPIFLFIGLGIIFYTFSSMNIDLIPVLTIIVLLSPVWLPFSMFLIVYERWMEAVHLKFEDDIGRITLRIKLPQEVLKSPEAMENVLHQVANHGKATNLMEAYLDGKYPVVHSFELVSIGGEIRFYVNVPIKKGKNLIESSLYAQYPGIEVVEEPIDYTAEIKWDPKKWDLMSFHFLKSGEDVLPIKTYVDWGLDKMPKEEYIIEPMAPLLEYLGNAKPHERVWIQILATPHANSDFSTGTLTKKETWQVAAQKKIDEMLGRDKSKIGPLEFEGQPRLTQFERDTVTAIERNISKPAYETAIRIIYIAETDKFSGEMITAMIRAMAHYEVVGRNKIAMGWRTDFDYKFFQDFFGTRRDLYKQKELDYYKMRFYLPFDVRGGKDKPKVMSIEEIATLYHIPGSSIITPALTRVESLRRDAPSNLPTGNPENDWS